MSTEQPKPLTGYRESQETKKEIHVDEKRFKEELHKVSESEESQQKSKRNLKKSEEENEEDELAAKQQQIKASGALFAMFMKESASNDHLTPQTPQNFRASEAPSTTSQFSIEQDTEETPPSPPSVSSQAPPPPITKGSQPLPQAPSMPTFAYQEANAPTPSEELPETEPQAQQPESPAWQPLSTASLEQPIEQVGPTEETYQPSTAQSPKRVEKKEEEKDHSLLAKHKPSKAQLQKNKEEKTPEIRLERKKEPPKPLTEEKQAPQALEEKKPATKEPALLKKQAPLGAKAHIEPEQIQPTAVKAPIEVKETKELEEPPVPLATKPTETKVLVSEKEPLSVEGVKTPKASEDKQPSKDKDKGKEKDEKNQEVLLTQPPAPMMFTPPPTPETPAYATLSPQIFELFEKMVGVMTIQENQGITTTTVTVNMKNSIFDGAQIILDHYSSAPNAFNVTIAASPEAQAVLNTNIDNLVASFEASKLSFQINLRRPVLLEEYQAFKRKEKVEAEPEQEQKQQQE